MGIKNIIEKTDTKAGWIFNIVVQVLILVSLVSFSLETMPDLSEQQRSILGLVETVTISFFTIEYLLRVAVADNRLKFIFSFYGLVDLFSILPFYIARSVDLRSLRALRLIRGLRILKFARFNAALERYRLAFQSIAAELAVFSFASLVLLYLSSVGIYYFENGAQPEAFSSIFGCMWWAVATLSTVGYGDIYPITVGGKVFTAVVVLLGLGVVAVPSGLLAAALQQASPNQQKNQEII